MAIMTLNKTSTGVIFAALGFAFSSVNAAPGDFARRQATDAADLPPLTSILPSIIPLCPTVAPPITVTTPVTVTSCPTPTPSPTCEDCNNLGLEWAYYSGAAVDPATIKTQTPLASGIGSYAGGPSIQGTCPSGGSAALSYGYSGPCEQFTLNIRGWFRAPSTGRYTVQLPDGIDDQVFVWVGANAYTGYDATNYLFADKLVNAQAQPGTSAFVNVQEGEYVPFRFIYLQDTGPYFFAITVIAPDGTIVVDNATPLHPGVIQYSCDETSAPRFPPFGQES